jgi:hypothetical protein
LKQYSGRLYRCEVVQKFDVLTYAHLSVRL